MAGSRATRTWVCHEGTFIHQTGGRSEPCCMEDEGGPLGIGVQAQVPNHLELLGLRVLVVSVEGNGVARPRQV